MTPEPTYLILNRIFNDVPGDRGSRWVAVSTHEEEPAQWMMGGPGDTGIFVACYDPAEIRKRLKNAKPDPDLPLGFLLDSKLTVEPPPKPKAAKVKTVKVFGES